MDKKLKVAVIGAGNVAQIAHLPAYRNHPDVEIAAIVEADIVRGRKVAAQYGVEAVYEDLTTMLREEPDVRAVDICTPNYLHAPMVIAALRSGRHVLCEKPLARNAAEAGRMVEAAKKAKTLLMVAMNNRYREDVMALQQFIKKGELGNVQLVKAGWRRTARSWRGGGWETDPAKAGGGALLDLGVPMMDLAMWIAGLKKATRVSCNVYGRQGKRGVEDSACAMVNFTGGACLLLEVTWNLLEPRDHTYFEVHGSKGGANLNPLRIHKGMHGHLVNVTPALGAGKADYRESYKREIHHFIDCVQKRRKPRTTPEEAQRVLHILDAMYKSAESGREVIFT